MKADVDIAGRTMPAKGDVLLSVKDVSLSFGGVKAIRGVSFDIKRGEIRAIIGPNGAGKTSMLNVINGFYHPQVGTITYKGEQREQMRPYIERSLDRIAATGVAMELNTSGAHKSLPEMNPSLSQLLLMRERCIPVVIGADAHVPQRVGDGYAKALHLLLAAGYTDVSFFLDRERHDISIQVALDSLH